MMAMIFIRVVGIQAQAVNLVEKYVLEVNLSADDEGFVSDPSTPSQHALLCSAITALLHTLMVSE